MTDQQLVVAHRCEIVATQSRWRINCTCGWKGPLVSLPGDGFEPWSAHFHEVTWEGVASL